jgi:hypothetical protein
MIRSFEYQAPTWDTGLGTLRFAQAHHTLNV